MVFDGLKYSLFHVDKLDLESPESLSGYVLILFQVVLNCKNGKLSQ